MRRQLRRWGERIETGLHQTQMAIPFNSSDFHIVKYLGVDFSI
jgi:hypothetical protein